MYLQKLKVIESKKVNVNIHAYALYQVTMQGETIDWRYPVTTSLRYQIYSDDPVINVEDNAWTDENGDLSLSDVSVPYYSELQKKDAHIKLVVDYNDFEHYEKDINIGWIENLFEDGIDTDIILTPKITHNEFKVCVGLEDSEGSLLSYYSTVYAYIGDKPEITAEEFLFDSDLNKKMYHFLPRWANKTGPYFDGTWMVTIKNYPVRNNSISDIPSNFQISLFAAPGIYLDQYGEIDYSNALNKTPSGQGVMQIFTPNFEFPMKRIGYIDAYQIKLMNYIGNNPEDIKISYDITMPAGDYAASWCRLLKTSFKNQEEPNDTYEIRFFDALTGEPIDMKELAEKNQFVKYPFF